MAGSPKKRARREAAAAQAAGLAPVVFTADGEQRPEPFVARTMSVEEFEAEGKRQHVLYTRELGELVCEALACGVALADVCGRPGMPSRRGIYGWRRAHPDFAAAMDDARRFRADSRADVIDGLLKDMESGKLDPITGRAIVDGHKWLMSKENARYADVSKVEMSGPNGGPIQVDDSPAAQMELARLLAFRLAQGERARRLLELQAVEISDVVPTDAK